MGLLANSNAIESGGYNIDRSLRFRSSASAYLSRTPASAGNRKTWTWSGWVKRGTLSAYAGIFGAWYGSGTGNNTIHFNNTDNLRFYDYNGSGFNFDLVTTQVFRDPSAWYHIAVAVDTTQATAANRIKIYVNGSQITSFSTASYPTQNSDGYINSTNAHYVSYFAGFGYYFDGYLAEVNFIDGQALTPSSFGQTDAVTGVWQPAKYTGTYGTNGFYLNFSDNTSATTLAYDKSGNGNNWTANNISTTAGATYDSMTDVPTLTSATAANYCVLNPLSKTSGTLVLSAANLKLGDGTAYSRCNSTMQVSSGKWYFEAVFTTAGANTTIGVGQGNITDQYPGQDALSYAFDLTAAKSLNNNVQPAYGVSLTTGDVFQVAFDLDNNKLFFGKNGTWMGSSDPVAGTNPVYTLTAGTYGAIARPYTTGAVIDVNFGQRPFSYTPPTGFKALNTFNLPDPTIKKPNQYMDATLWTGNGTYPRAITNAGSFQPDLLWIKNRSNAYSHALWDSSRGTGGNLLISNTTDSENTYGTLYQNLSSFNSNGFTLAAPSSTDVQNATGQTQVAWQWKESATAGFDIVTYTGTGSNGQTVAHNLGVTPKMVILKARSSALDWIVYHAGTATPTANNLWLNLTNSVGNNPGFLTPNASNLVFTTSYSANNANGVNMVAYCFAEIAGFSKFGSYTGNGSADGPFVYCGFRPKYVLIKNATTAATNWFIYDSIRDTYNITGNYLRPNLSDAEATFGALDLLSNGFKIRDASANNTSGATLIFAAFAESPFKTSLAR